MVGGWCLALLGLVIILVKSQYNLFRTFAILYKTLYHTIWSNSQLISCKFYVNFIANFRGNASEVLDSQVSICLQGPYTLFYLFFSPISLFFFLLLFFRLFFTLFFSFFSPRLKFLWRVFCSHLQRWKRALSCLTSHFLPLINVWLIVLLGYFLSLVSV